MPNYDGVVVPVCLTEELRICFIDIGKKLPKCSSASCRSTTAVQRVCHDTEPIPSEKTLNRIGYYSYH